MRMHAHLLLCALALTACQTRTNDTPLAASSARQRFLRSVDSLLLDTVRYEMRAQLSVKVRNPNRDDESPLADSSVTIMSGSTGPHTYDGRVWAEVGSLQTLLGRDVPARVETDRDLVFVGTPPAAIVSHRHGDTVYVDVKLFARQYGAYVDVSCTMATCASIWRRDIITFMRGTGILGAGLFEGHAEGLVTGIDPTKRPAG